MTVGTFFWHVVIPVERQNLVSNPSLETGTAGWAGTGASAVLGTSAAGQALGAWAMTATGATDGLGATYTTPSLGSGSAVTASAYARITGASGGSVKVSLGGTSYQAAVGSTWQRIAVGTVQTATATRTLAVQRYGAVGASGTLWVDGVQAEYGSVTTYIDGDQEGCQWIGAPHASQSYRSGQTRAGGSVVPLATLGMRVETHAGVGMPPVANLAQSRAVLDGAEYQRTRAEAREFTLTATLTGTTVADLHQTRRAVIDALKVNRTTPQAPTRFLYTGAGGTVQIDAVYAGGLDITDMGVINDHVAARFTAFEPLWRDTLDEGTALAPYTVLGSTNYIAYRDPLGRWGTMGANGTSVDDIVHALVPLNGTLFVGGVTMTSAGGTQAIGMAQWADGAWGTLPGGTLGAAGVASVRAILPYGGTLFVGGVFAGVAGTQGTSIAQYAGGAWGTLAGGTLFGGGLSAFPTVNALAINDAGTLFVGGQLSHANGTLTRGIFRWYGGAWGSLSITLGTNTGLLEPIVRTLLITPSGTLWMGGRYGSVFFLGGGTVAGGPTAIPNPGTVGTIPGMAYSNASNGTAVRALVLDNNQRLYATLTGNLNNEFLAAARIQAGGVALLANLNDGGKYSVESNPTFTVGPNGDLYVTSSRTGLGNREVPFGLNRWNGYSWILPDLRHSDTNPDVRAATFDTLGTLYVGGDFIGIGTAAAVMPVVNTGMSGAYPIIRIRNTGNGTARIYQLVNETTNDGIYFDLLAQPGEYLLLDLTPGNHSFISLSRGNMIGAVMGGSNLATWRLQPGTNYVSFFADEAGVRADLYWRPRHESADGGADPTI